MKPIKPSSHLITSGYSWKRTCCPFSRNLGGCAQEWAVRHRQVFILVATLAALLELGRLAPALFLHILGAPSAWLASLWLGGPLVSDADGYWILNMQKAVCITNSCNGSGFFALLAALTTPYWHRKFPLLCPYSHGALLFAAPFAATIAANTCRIIAVWYAARLTTRLDISAWHGTIHYVSGLLVFFGFLVAYHLIMERIHHERNAP